jgi:formylglycine-generating enzyme required for sulfatase activity
MFRSASSSVSPCDQQPGRPGTETLKPSSDSCSAILYLRAGKYIACSRLVHFAAAATAKGTTPAGRGDMPVNSVSWYDSLRFVNWLHNGQLSGAQDGTTTEDGAYTFSGATSVGSRNAGATIFLTSEDEWYKAAYYDAVSTSYFDYPVGSDLQTTCAAPGAGASSTTRSTSQRRTGSTATRPSSTASSGFASR